MVEVLMAKMIYIWKRLSYISYIYYFLPLFTVSCTKPVIFLLCNNLFIYQVLCTLIYRRRSLYSFLLEYVFMITKHNHEAISWSHVTQINDTWNHYIPISHGKPAMLLQTAFRHKHPDLFSVSYSPNQLSVCLLAKLLVCPKSHRTNKVNSCNPN